MVSVDVYRPAAREQLNIVARDVGLPIYEGAPGETQPLDLARSARREAIKPAATSCWWIPPAACTSTIS